MTALTDIGELSISDSREGGKDYLLRPSFEAMTRIGTPEEIVQAYATIHGNDVAQLIEVCAGTLGRFLNGYLHHSTAPLRSCYQRACWCCRRAAMTI
jgi:hypothetical protein